MILMMGNQKQQSNSIHHHRTGVEYDRMAEEWRSKMQILHSLGL